MFLVTQIPSSTVTEMPPLLTRISVTLRQKSGFGTSTPSSYTVAGVLNLLTTFSNMLRNCLELIGSFIAHHCKYARMSARYKDTPSVSAVTGVMPVLTYHLNSSVSSLSVASSLRTVSMSFSVIQSDHSIHAIVLLSGVCLKYIIITSSTQ